MNKLSPFQALLYEKFIGINSSFTVKQVSPEVDRAVSTFYAYCRGEEQFPVDLLGELLRATDDPQFIEVFLRGTHFGIHRIPDVEDISDNTKVMLKNMKRFGDLADSYQKSIEDGKIDRKEKKELTVLTRELIGELVSFIKGINA